MPAADPPLRILRVALGGGVGTGKSALGDRLESLGAYRIDADQLARDVVAAGTPGLDSVVARFGPEVLTAAGELDRPAVAALVFADPAARNDLNGLLHPRIAELSQQRMAAAPAGAIVVYEIPLLNAARAADFDVVVVVEAPLSVRLERLTGRGLDESSARARIAAQASDAELRALADEVADNSGPSGDLAETARVLWARLRARQAANS